jgi:hypothetical protein
MSSASKGQSVSAVATTGTNPTAQNSIEQVSTPQAPPVANNQSKNLQDIFDKLKQGNQKRDFYEKFCEKLDEVEQFRADHDGSGLVATITSQSTGKEIYFSNLAMILRFIDDAIQQGKKGKEGLEVEILNLTI